MSHPYPHPAWPTFIDPHRYVEATQALKHDLPGLLAARGQQFGETALHWAAMGEISLMTDMVQAGNLLWRWDQRRCGRVPVP